MFQSFRRYIRFVTCNLKSLYILLFAGDLFSDYEQHIFHTPTSCITIYFFYKLSVKAVSAVGVTPLWHLLHYSNVTMSVMASQITSLMIVYSIIYSGSDQRKHQCSESLDFVRVIVMADFFQTQKIIMMPSSNLYNVWLVHNMHLSGHFPCKIYWLFALIRSAPEVWMW